MYGNKAPLWASASMLLKVYSLLWLPLISSAQPSLLHLEDRLLIFCQEEKHTIIMLPFEIPSLSFFATEIRCISLKCMWNAGGIYSRVNLVFLIKHTVALVDCLWHREWSGHLEGYSSGKYAFNVPEGSWRGMTWHVYGSLEFGKHI